jgi:hypothetical protein
MKNIPKNRRGRHNYSDGPLFDWAEEATQDRFTPGGAWVHRRTGLPADRCNLLAELNGLGRRER